MKIHFTNLFGQSSKSVALMAQNDIMNVVRELGVNELGIYFYDHSNEPASELNSRMDGILAGVAFGDIVFVQSPSWNGIEWDRRLVDKLKLLQTKLVMFIHDVPPLMFESNYYLMPNYIDMYNQSDLVVVPSEQMYHRLVSEGLTVKKYVVQKLWDLTHSLDLYTPQFEKKLIFSGNPSRFPHIISSIGNMRHPFMSIPNQLKESIILRSIWKAGGLSKSCFSSFPRVVLGLSGEILRILRMSGITTKKIFPTNYRPIYLQVFR